MNDPTTSTATISSDSMTMAEMAALIYRFPAIPRDVFSFDGTLVEFKRCLDTTGITIRDRVVTLDCPPSGWIDPSNGLPCWEFDGKVWIGSLFDILEARAGRRPFQTIERRVAT